MEIDFSSNEIVMNHLLQYGAFESYTQLPKEFIDFFMENYHPKYILIETEKRFSSRFDLHIRYCVSLELNKEYWNYYGST